MDYAYGNLQHHVEKVEYKGVRTETTEVLINPRENLIAVNVLPLSPSILKPQIDFQKDGDYILVGIVEDTRTHYEWRTKEEVNDFIQKQIDDLQVQIHQIDVNESQYREQIAIHLKQIEKEIASTDSNLEDTKNELSSFETLQHSFNNTVTVYMDTNDRNISKLFTSLKEEIETREEEDTKIHEELNQFEITQNQVNEDTSRNIEAIDGTLNDMIERDACFVSVDINEDYTVTVSIYNNDKELLDSGTINIPLASVIVKAEYDEDTKCIILYLADGSVLTIPVGDIISGLAKQGAVDKEIYDREQADKTLQNNIDTETNSRISADRALLSTINSSVAALNEEDANLQAQITAEVEARESADTTLQSNIDAEATTRENADTDLQDQVEKEIFERKEADTTLQSNINAEATAREEADKTLQSNIDIVTADLNTEVNTRTENDATTFTMVLDHDTYVLTFELLNAEGKQLKSEYVDFPEEIIIMDMTYDSDTKTIVITLRNGEKRYIPLNDLVSGLVTTTTFDSWVATIEAEIATWEGLLVNETEARTNADTALNSLITAISDSVSSQISNLETRLEDGIGTATTQATNAAESAKQAQESAENAQSSADEAVEKVDELNIVINGNEETGEIGLVGEVQDIQENKTSVKVKEELIDEDTQEVETIYTSIPNLYFDGNIERDEEGNIEEITIIFDCGGAK